MRDKFRTAAATAVDGLNLLFPKSRFLFDKVIWPEMALLHFRLLDHQNEELGQRFSNTKTAAPSIYRVHAATEKAAEDNGINAYYGFYSVTGNVYTDELTAVSKPVIREFQQASWLHRQEAGHLHELSRYHAIADFDEWRLYRLDAGAVNGKIYQDEIAVFWGNTRSRLLKFRGMNKNTLYLHVKESEFRYNYREDDINKVLLNIIYKYPLHLSKSYV